MIFLLSLLLRRCIYLLIMYFIYFIYGTQPFLQNLLHNLQALSKKKNETYTNL